MTEQRTSGEKPVYVVTVKLRDAGSCFVNDPNKRLRRGPPKVAISLPIPSTSLPI